MSHHVNICQIYVIQFVKVMSYPSLPFLSIPIRMWMRMWMWLTLLIKVGSIVDAPCNEMNCSDFTNLAQSIANETNSSYDVIFFL